VVSNMNTTPNAGCIFPLMYTWEGVRKRKRLGSMAGEKLSSLEPQRWRMSSGSKDESREPSGGLVRQRETVCLRNRAVGDEIEFLLRVLILGITNLIRIQFIPPL
jgi:hypothetical protein